MQETDDKWDPTHVSGLSKPPASWITTIRCGSPQAAFRMVCGRCGRHHDVKSGEAACNAWEIIWNFHDIHKNCRAPKK